MKRFLSLLCVVALTACAANTDVNHYDSSSVGQVGSASSGVIINARPITISTENGAVGQIAGGIAGGVLGNTIGGSSVANTIGAVGGSVLGGYLGGKAQQGLSTQSGMEYVVKLDSGRAITLTQGTTPVFHVGDEVYVLDGSRARLIPKN